MIAPGVADHLSDRLEPRRRAQGDFQHLQPARDQRLGQGHGVLKPFTMVSTGITGAARVIKAIDL